MKVCAFILGFFLVLAAGGLAPGCASRAPLQRFDYAQVIMGVRVNIAAYCENEVKARSAAKAAFDELVRVDNTLTDYRPDSEAMHLCDAAGQGPVPVSPMLAEVLRRAGEFSQASGGAFDVTVGPMVRLWRAARRAGRLPAADALDAARTLVDWRSVSVHTDASGENAVTLASPGMRLDFGAIGKGYGADRALATLRVEGVPVALVSVAGDIAAGDPPPGRPGWRVDMTERGPAVAGGPHDWIEVSNVGVSTSGDTEQFVEIDGVRYSHIVDPRTGLGVTRHVLATVVARDATTSDAAATALCVLDPLEHARFLHAIPGTEARVRLAGRPDFGESVTRGFPTVRHEP